MYKLVIAIISIFYFFTNFFMIFKEKIAFTLAELMVWITVIWIIGLWISNINFSRLSSKQNLEIFANQIKSHFENVRNNSLSWKWIWINLDIPKNRKIEYSQTNNWNIISKTTLDWTSWQDYNNLEFKYKHEITKIRCWLYNENETNYDQLLNWNKVILIFEWINIRLEWASDCDNSKDKILELTISNWVDEKTVTINVLNWIAIIK